MVGHKAHDDLYSVSRASFDHTTANMARLYFASSGHLGLGKFSHTEVRDFAKFGTSGYDSLSIREQLRYNNGLHEVVTSIHFMKIKTKLLQNLLDSNLGHSQIFSLVL